MGDTEIKGIMEGNFLWLQKRFYQQCDDDWEHQHGIKIRTLDNPGWYITICLEETEFENKKFQKVITERSDSDWFHCFVREGKFEGACGPFNFNDVLQLFKNWVDNGV